MKDISENRQVTITAVAPPVNRDEIVDILVRRITGGDPKGYLLRLRARIDAEREAAGGCEEACQ